MPWIGGNFVRANGNTGWQTDATNGIGIEAGRHDTQDNDFKDGIDQCLTKNGANTAIADLNMGGKQVVNITSGSAAAPAICAGNDINTGIFSPGADQIGVATNGVERLRITDNGSLLKGNTSARSNFYSGWNATDQIEYADATAGGAVASRLFMKVHNANSTDAGYFGLAKTRGTTVGSNTIVASGDQLGGITFQGADGTNFIEGARIQAFVDATPGTNDMPTRLVFSTTPDGAASSTERMRIDSAGRVGIGAASFASAQLYAFTDTASRYPARFYQAASGDTGTPAIYLDKQANNSTTAQVFLQASINSQTTAQGQVNANGASQLAFGSYSDERLKENIIDLPSQLAKIFSLRPVEFDYKDGSGHQIGFVAQEVQEIYPDLIGEGTDGFLTLSGLGKNEARMIKAFQEFAELTQAKIAALEARVAELEA